MSEAFCREMGGC
jgi:hypothetical protein